MKTLVKCRSCSWQGSEDSLVPVYVADTKHRTDVVPEPGCPKCNSIALDYEEVSDGYTKQEDSTDG